MDRLTRYDKEDNYWTLFCGEESGDACMDKCEQAMYENASDHCTIFAPCPVEQRAVDRLAAYEDIGYSPEDIAALASEVEDIKKSVDQLYADQKFVKMLEAKGIIDVDATLDRVNAWLEAEEQGRLVVLPVPVGTVMSIDGDPDYPVTITDVGVYVSAIEEGEWNNLQDFMSLYASEIARAEKSE